MPPFVLFARISFPVIFKLPANAPSVNLTAVASVVLNVLSPDKTTSPFS